MKAYRTVEERIRTMRESWETDADPEGRNIIFNEQEEDRRIGAAFSTLMILYGADGREWSVSPSGERKRVREVPRQGSFHRHAYIELLYIAQGSFSQILLGEKRSFSRGEIVITDQNCEHADYIEEKDAAVIFLQIREEYMERILRSYDGRDDLHRFLFHAMSRQKKEQSFLELSRPGEDVPDGDLEEMMETLVSESLNQAPGYEDICRGTLLRLLWHLCTEYSPILHTDSREVREKAVLYELERYIHMHPAGVSAKELEQQFHYHRNYYNLLLKKYRDVTLQEYVAEVRMNYARELLAGTDYPVRTVALMCGYENTSHFYRLFRKTQGAGPSDFRKST